MLAFKCLYPTAYPIWIGFPKISPDSKNGSITHNKTIFPFDSAMKSVYHRVNKRMFCAGK